MIGQQIAHYKVTAKLGAGGMGEVYRATDTKLGRDVALKVLPTAFAQDAQRMQRFQREAQVLASLNHPNIATIHGLEEAGSVRALVMELVEGPTLAARIAGGAVPLDEAVPIAKQICEALEYAHEKGIVHRDLKPANIKLTPDGKVKVLDFGLAKALAEDSAVQDISASPTLSMAATKAGVILGTAAYMSPEQARGKPVDRRADVWSFGVVLFEMLAGKQLYGGETASDSMAAVMTREPDWDDLPASTPRRIRELLRRCLTKDLRRRLQAIGDARIELEEADQPEASSGAAVPVAAGSSSWRGPALTAVLVLAALAAGAGLQSLRTPVTAPLSVTRVARPVDEASLTTRTRLMLAISLDGSKMVHVANRRLHVRSLDSLSDVELPGTEGAAGPFFSPDGQWVGFFVDGQTKKIAVAGGTPIIVCAKDGFDGSWGPNDTILIGTAFSGILAVPAQGGTPTVLVPPEPGILHLKARALADGKTFLYVRGASGTGFDKWETVMRSFEKDDSTVVLQGANQVVYAPTGHLVYARLPELFAVPFDLATRRTTGGPVRVTQDVDFTNAGGTTQFALSETGTLVYLSAQGVRGLQTRLVAVDRAGKTTPLPLDARDYSDPKISPDGRLIAAHLQDAQNDVWVGDAAKGTMSRLSFDPAEDETPVWSPDGRTVAWTATRSSLARGVFRRAADGSGKEELLWSLDKHAHLRDWLPDGRGLLLEIVDPGLTTDIWRLDLGEKPTATVFLQTRFNERNSRISPDGRWIAYVSEESGRDEVYIQSFPAAGAKVQVSSGGGDQPVWARNGKAIYFRAAGAMQEATFEASPRLAVGKPRALFPDRFENPQSVGGHTGYDVFPDGRFLMIQGPDSRQSIGDVRYQIVFVFNWFEELRRLTAAEKKK